MIGGNRIEGPALRRQPPEAAARRLHALVLVHAVRRRAHRGHRYRAMPQRQLHHQIAFDSSVVVHRGLLSSGLNGLALPWSLPLASTAAAAHRAGTAPAMNICCGVHCAASMKPPMIGPMIEPIRPMPSAHPTPVDRITVG